MYEILLVILSLLMGWGLARITKEELAAGKRYFQVICLGALLTLAVLILMQGLSWMLMLGVVLGLIVGLFFQQPYFYFGMLGMMTAWGFPREGFVLLVALFSLASCSLMYRMMSWRWMGIAVGLFILPYGLLLIPDSALFFAFTFSIFYGMIIGGFVHVARRLYSGA